LDYTLADKMLDTNSVSAHRPVVFLILPRRPRICNTLTSPAVRDFKSLASF